MSNYKEFQGKTLDDAIRDACGYYGVEREKLEIEILSDAKTGIFGLVGAKKAAIRAARTQLSVATLMTQDAPSTASSGEAEAAHSPPLLPEKSRSERSKKPEARKQATTASGLPGDSSAKAPAPVSGDRDERPRGGGRRSGSAPERTEPSQPAEAGRKKDLRDTAPGGEARTNAATESSDESKAQASRQRNKPAGKAPQRGQDNRGSGRRDASQSGARPGRAASRPSPANPVAFTGSSSPDSDAGGLEERMADSLREDLPEFVLEGCDEARLSAVVSDVIRRLVLPIVGDVPCTVAIAGGRVRAAVDCGEASGLLVGREGQTLASVQYLAARIIAKEIGGSLRLQIDAGNYRERQDDRLKELALTLAERAKQSRRSQSTRPLTAYQRRIVHMALEGDDAVQTHSKGEGAQRRVIIQLRRGDRPQPEAGSPLVPENDIESDDYIEPGNSIANNPLPPGMVDDDDAEYPDADDPRETFGNS